MRNVLRKLWIIQDSKINKKIRTRLNPYNPLSYLTIVLVIVVGVLLFGFMGIFDEIEMRNPFKWY